MPKPSPINANSPVFEEPVSGAGNKLFQEFKLVDTLLTLSHSAVSEYLLIYLKNTTFINSMHEIEIFHQHAPFYCT